MIKIHDMLDDRKTKPGAALFAAAPFIHPVKPLKNTALALRADAPVSEDGEASSEKEDSDAAPDDSTTVTVEEITE